jgi:hypothetical protein
VLEMCGVVSRESWGRRPVGGAVEGERLLPKKGEVGEGP